MKLKTLLEQVNSRGDCYDFLMCDSLKTISKILNVDTNIVGDLSYSALASVLALNFTMGNITKKEYKTTLKILINSNDYFKLEKYRYVNGYLFELTKDGNAYISARPITKIEFKKLAKELI